MKLKTFWQKDKLLKMSKFSHFATIFLKVVWCGSIQMYDLQAERVKPFILGLCIRQTADSFTLFQTLDVRATPTVWWIHIFGDFSEKLWTDWLFFCSFFSNYNIHEIAEIFIVTSEYSHGIPLNPVIWIGWFCHCVT